MELIGTTLFPGSGRGPLLALGAPLSFWGGVDPDTGRIINARHPQHGATLGGVTLYMPRLIGSSSSSSILLELIRNRCAPAALVLGERDAILVVGALVAREMGLTPPPVVECAEWPAVTAASDVSVAAPEGYPAHAAIQIVENARPAGPENR